MQECSQCGCRGQFSVPVSSFSGKTGTELVCRQCFVNDEHCLQTECVHWDALTNKCILEECIPEYN